jgi:subtilisin family serine protease
MPQSQRLLLKLRPQTALGAADPRVNLRPLFDTGSASSALGLSGTSPTWHIADVQESGPTLWDAAHNQAAAALGLDSSAILFAEPDLPQHYPDSNEANAGGSPFAASPPNCAFQDQNNDQRPSGPGFAWHLRDEFSQLGSAHASVAFTDQKRTRIAHIDTGYDPSHLACPARILHALERNFVNDDGTPNSATDPNRGHLFDNSGHGTGTIGILAGPSVPQNGNLPYGGAPNADILPLRVANSVVLFFTSALAQAIQYAIQQNCDVVSLSMGGLPSGAWNDAVNAAYEAGICIVAASGDCFGGLPTHHVVYPARYRRTIAACGVMENGAPYFNLPLNIIEGSFGPDSAMTAALAAYTPNTPWAKFGCHDIIDMNGAGTSSSTPQIAAAAALWYEKYKTQLPRDWRRVEAVRDALFRSARNTDATHFGKGILQANAALGLAPRLSLPKTAPDNDSFAFFRVITGLGLVEPSPTERMLNVELAQRYLVNRDMQAAVPEPTANVPTDALKKFLDALIADPGASQFLRRAVAARYPALFGSSVSGVSLPDITPARAVPRPRPNAVISNPPYRRIRTYAVDPSFSASLKTSAINQGLLKLRWERLEKGPKGEYIEVVDMDGETPYDPVDLDDPRLLAQDGFPPAEGNAQFHQQMAFAVAMTTIERFEMAMGRRVLWRHKVNPLNPKDDSTYVQRLQIHPHAFRQENAFYDPLQVALRFGYFKAARNDPGDHVPDSTVFTCLSHDVVAHETTHAILDGMHRRFTEPTNLDVLAFHEAFADIVALMQHFTMPEILEDQIANSRGDLESETMLGSMATQFGHTSGGRGALREAIGEFDAQGIWHRQKPNPADYAKTTEPHRRGALLVAAVFDAFLLIYKRRTADLYRIATGGTGVLSPGAMHPDLVRRLASEATKSAGHTARMCMRALDYIPPVDITFGEYLRGIITADFDLVPDDTFGYRVAFVEAFRRRGIYPDDLDTLSVETLRWQGIDLPDSDRRFDQIVERLRKFANDSLYIDSREMIFERTRNERRTLHEEISRAIQADSQTAAALGILPDLKFEVHELRRAERTGPDGRPHPQAIVAIVQERQIQVPGSDKTFPFYGGATLIVDLKNPGLKYAIYKRVNHQNREREAAAYIQRALKDPVAALLLDQDRVDRFAALHSLAAGSY